MAFARYARDPFEDDPDDDQPPPFEQGPADPAPPPAPDPGPPPMSDVVEGFSAPGGGGGGGGPAYGGLRFDFEGVPNFEAAEFRAPTLEEAMREPGYEFRLKAGNDALQKSAAARGVLRSGGTLKDLVQYGQNFATQEYANVFNRALQGYGANYQRAKDMFAPRMAEWQQRARAHQAARMAEWQASLMNRGGGGGGGYQPLPDDFEPQRPF